MRILHTADWHLGRRLNRASRLDEQREVLASLVDRTRELDPDAVVLAGDVFDVFTPGADAERLYYDALQALAEGGTRPVLVVAGNHDSPSRLTAPGSLLASQGVFVHGDPHDPADAPEPGAWEGFEIPDAGPGWLTVDRGGEQALFHLLPFPSRARLPSEVDDPDASATEVVQTLADAVPEGPGRRFLVGHLYVRGDHGVEEGRDDYVGGAYAVATDALDAYDAAFLGHLHQPFGADAWRYAGAPLAFDADDPEVDRGAWLFEDGDWTMIPLEGGRRVVERRPADVDAALALADEGSHAWTRLVFQRGTVLTRSERERVREAFGDRLVDIRFAAPDPDDERQPARVDLGDVDPEAAFRRYVEDETDQAPADALVDLFLDVLNPEEDPDAVPGAGGQATLEVGE